VSNKFDELTKSLAQLVTRRAALKKFGAGLAGMALACFGLANKAEAVGPGWPKPKCGDCVKPCEAQGFPFKYCRDVVCAPYC